MYRLSQAVLLCCLWAAACGDDVAVTGASSGVGGGPSAGGGGAGGATPSCTVANDCAADEQCTVVDLELGVGPGSACVEVGPQTAYSRCSTQADCAADLFCDRSTAVCKPVCDAGGQPCESGGACTPALDELGDSVPGLHVCVAACDPGPSITNSCGDGNQTTCYFRDDLGVLDCAASAGGTWQSACAAHSDCAFSFACIGGMCLDLCLLEGILCDGFTKAGPDFFCTAFEPCGTCEKVPRAFGDADVLACIP